jgi:branched-chain amino acid transport system permease protein
LARATRAPGGRLAAERWAWAGFAAVLVAAPLLVGSSGLGVSVLSQIGIAIVACLSLDILLGQGGMLSFGHAVYTGLGSFVAIHALEAIGDGTFPVPVSLVPLVGGLAGLAFAVVLGWVTTRRSGTAFAMITLGIGELVSALALIIPEFFGGEAGVSANRVAGEPFLGITFAPAIEVYYLIALYTLACTAAMVAFMRTPLGRLLNAVRDNAERVEFIGYSAQRIRFLAFLVAGFFAGVSGGMYALHFEIATAEVVGTARSGSLLLFTFLGGIGTTAGPLIGAVLFVLTSVLLSGVTRAWLLYLGLAFVLTVMYAPGGMAAVAQKALRRAPVLREPGNAISALAFAVGLLTFAAGATSLIELVYHQQLGTAGGSTFRFLGTTLDTARASDWLGALALAAMGLLAVMRIRPPMARAGSRARAGSESP